MDRLAPVDVVIVGSGWCGMIMAKEIATRTPLSVLVLERGGPFRGYGAFAEDMDEVDTFIRMRHAENPANGHGLSARGAERAEAYKNYFLNFSVDSKRLEPNAVVVAADSKQSHRPLRFEASGIARMYRPD